LDRVADFLEEDHASGRLVGLFRVIIPILVVAGLGYGGYKAYGFVTGSPHFRVTKLKFNPTVHLDEKELRRLSGVNAKTNIFKVDLDEMKRRFERHPWVAKATINRRLPDTLKVKIVEQQAAAIVAMGTFYLVNDQGEPFKKARLEEVMDHPVISGIARQAYEKNPVKAKKRIREALRFLRRYREKPRPAIGELHLEADRSFVIYTRKKAVEVRLGKGGWNQKLLRLDAILTALGDETGNVRVIRLDNEVRPQRVTVQIAEET
jgi:cell division protein FtsQ